jgi:hypothetical protein
VEDVKYENVKEKGIEKKIKTKKNINLKKYLFLEDWILKK